MLGIENILAAENLFMKIMNYELIEGNALWRFLVMLVIILISLAIGVLLQGVVDPQAADWEKVTNNGVEMILDSITRR